MSVLRAGLLCTLLLLRPPVAAQPVIGIEHRVPNTSLLIDLQTEPAPATISASGVFSDVAMQTPAPGLIPYSVNSELWSDGTHKVRYLALPGTAQIGFSVDGRWTFPANTVLVKSFYLNQIKNDPRSRRIIETRFLVKVGDSPEWKGFSYLWNEDGTDADLLSRGHSQRYAILDPEAPDGLTHVDYGFPAPEDCGGCHTQSAGEPLGVRTAQLNGLHDYGSVEAHQLQTLNAIGLFNVDVGTGMDTLPRWEDPRDETAPLAGRARAYLASNCSHCHRPGGLRRTDIDLRHGTDLEATGTVDVPSQLDDLDGVNRRIIAPGDAANSVLSLRMRALDKRRMPPLATTIIDEQGVELVASWIDALDALGAPTAIADVSGREPTMFALDSHPNPFNASATISYAVDKAGAIELVVHDITGRHVRTLVASRLDAGHYEVRWDGLDDDGRRSASGVYLARLRRHHTSRTTKLTLLK